MQWARKQSGFTIVELLIVVVVIAILAAITIVAYNGIQNRAATAALQADLRNAATALGVHYATTNSYPASTDTVNEGKGLAKASTTRFQYSQLSGGSGFCITGTTSRGGVAAYYVSDATGIQEGACSGHTTSHIAIDCPTGFIVVPGNSTFGTSDFCVMKYEAKDVSGTATSQPAAAPWTGATQNQAATRSQNACSGCHLVSEAEWMTIAANVLSVPANWSGGSVGSGFIYSGHNDNGPNTPQAASANDASGYTGTNDTAPSNQRRTLTLTNGEVIWDFAGNVWEWTQGTITGGQPGSGTSYVPLQYNAISNWASFPVLSRPGAISSDAASLHSGHGIGILFANAGDGATKGFVRGGDWTTPINGGVLSLYLAMSPSDANEYVGFRVAK